MAQQVPSLSSNGQIRMPSRFIAADGLKAQVTGASVDVFLAELSKTEPSKRRPLLVNLNGDTTLLICIPYPTSLLNASSKAFYYIVADPWFIGPAFIFPVGIFTIQHSVPEAFRDFRAIDMLVTTIEWVAAQTQAKFDKTGMGMEIPTTSPQGFRRNSRKGIDAILITGPIADHTHPETLLTADPDIPVLANETSFLAVQGLHHFKTVKAISPYGGLEPNLDRPFFDITELPASEAGAVTNAIIISMYRTPVFNQKDSFLPECILLSPHGISPRSVAEFASQGLLRTAKILAYLGPLNQNLTNNLPTTHGAHDGLKIYRETDAKYWVSIHDAINILTGMFASTQRTVEITLEEALEQEEAEQGTSGGPVNFIPMVNGGFHILE